jgi:NADH dehydrogenase [ubiquinone] 1 alpha subcomplex assembly factor 2
MKMLAAQADVRWATKPSAMDAPDKQQPVQMLESRDHGHGIRQMNADQEVRHRAESTQPLVDADTIKSKEESREQVDEEGGAPSLRKSRVMKKEPKDSPWKQAASRNPGGDWQPDSWTPGPARRNPS